MDILSNTGDFIELLIYFTIFIGIILYSAIKSKYTKPNQYNNVVVQCSIPNNALMYNVLNSDRIRNYIYQISKTIPNKSICGNSATNISYIYTFIIFLAVGLLAVILIIFLPAIIELNLLVY